MIRPVPPAVARPCLWVPRGPLSLLLPLSLALLPACSSPNHSAPTAPEKTRADPAPTTPAAKTAAAPETPGAMPSALARLGPEAAPGTHGPDAPARAAAAAGSANGADVIADFEMMCAALNRDYVDGTLTDYYRDVKPKTELGQRLRREGDESTQPGRALEAALKQHRASGPGADMPQCAALFEELDDLE